MPRHPAYVPHGVIPAVLLPFHEDFSIDEESFRAHLREVAATSGISAITVNAHSTEVASCSFEEQLRVLQQLARPVNVLTTHSAWLLSSLVLGCNGLLSGSGSVIADFQAQLFAAVQKNDLAEARRLNDRIYPLARAFYAEPWADMHNRMKEALVILGRQKRAVVRPPLVKLGDPEIGRIRQALVDAGLLQQKADAA